MAAPKGFRSWQDYFDRHIANCENCAPYFQGEGYVSIEGTHSTVEDLHHIDVPARLTKRLIENGHCAGCGSAIEEMAECWVRPTTEVMFHRRLEAATKRYGPRLSEFRDYLSKHPFLGASHPTGRALIRAVEKVPPITVDGRWYRGLRRLEPSRVPNSDDFRAPDDSRSSIGEGRFNHAGQAHWYLADSAATCVAELLDCEAGVVDVQKVKLAACGDILDVYCPDGAEPFGRSDHLTDLALALILIDTNLYARVERHRAWKAGYLLPRFVMDAAKAAGFAGIRYRSVRTFGGQNVVLFNRETPAIFVGKPARYEQDDLATRFDTSAGEDLL